MYGHNMSEKQIEDKEQELLDKVRDLLKHSAIVAQMFEKFDTSIKKIEDVPIQFSDIDVSAKTKDKKIYLNNILIDDDDFTNHMHYVVHELCHFLQQFNGEVSKYKNLDEMDYLDQPTEIEAFNYQIKFIKELDGQNAADKYLKDLLDFHEYKGTARDRKSHELLE